MVDILSRTGTVLLRASASTLQDVNLRNADLCEADLRGADLWEADLRGANLQDAALQGANLRGADLRRSLLFTANLQNAILRTANLQDTILYNADLRRADLQSAALQGADLRGTDFRGAILPTGESWETYCTVVVPALCQAGGRSLARVAAVWACHTWENCPMAVAFGVQALHDVPLLYQPRVEQFIAFFDAGLLPCPIEYTSFT